MTSILHLIALPRLALALLTLLLTACVSTPPPVVPVTPPAPALPAIKLDQSLLYDFLLGEMALQRGYDDIAVDAMARVAMASRDPRTVSRAAQVANARKKYSQALVIANLWLKLAPDAAEPLGIIAVAQLQLGHRNVAEKALRTQLEKGQPNLKLAYRKLAAVMLQVVVDQPALAIAVMKKLVALHPKSADAWLMLALVAERAKDRTAIMYALDQALIVRPDWEDAALAKFSQLSQTKNTDAEKFIKNWLTSYPNSGQVQTTYGQYLLKKGRKTAALQAFEVATRLLPNNLDAHYAAALLSFQTKKFATATVHLQQALKLHPNDPMLQIMLGQSYASLQQYPQALDIFSVVKGDKPSFQARLLSSEVLIKQGKTTQALEFLSQTLTSSPDQEIQLILEKNQLFRKLKAWKSSKAMLDKAILRYPEDNRLLTAHGLAAAELRMVDQVEQDMRLLIKREPNNAQAYNSLGYTLADQTDRYAEALILLQKANTLLPQNPFILDSLGWLYFRMDQTDKAVDFLQQALTLRQDPEISAHLGEVLWSIGQQRKARDIWQKAYRQASDNSVLNATIKRFINP